MPLFKGLSSKSTPRKAIDYITREDKAAFVSMRNLFEDEDYSEQFADTMRRFGKGKKFDERKYYHFKLSCARKDNVSPEQAHLYAEELAAILFPDDECVIATHTDTKTVHSHIIVNAVNPITGKKLRITESDYTKMKDEANRLGVEFGYSSTDFRKKAQNKRTTQESHIIMKGGTSWKEDLREVIEEAKSITINASNFNSYFSYTHSVSIEPFNSSNPYITTTNATYYYSAKPKVSIKTSSSLPIINIKVNISFYKNSNDYTSIHSTTVNVCLYASNDFQANDTWNIAFIPKEAKSYKITITSVSGTIYVMDN